MDKQGIKILGDEMNEFTLTNIKTRKAMVQYGTRGSSESSHSLSDSCVDVQVIEFAKYVLSVLYSYTIVRGRSVLSREDILSWCY